MPFDLSTATPMSAATSGGFDLSTATPVGLPSSGIEDLKLSPQEENLYQHHVHNWENGGYTKNPDGSYSTIRQETIEVNGKTYSIPTVWDGQILDSKSAVERAKKEGLDKFPSYASDAEAQSRYDAMHKYMEKDMEAGPPSEVKKPVATTPSEPDNWPVLTDIGQSLLGEKPGVASGFVRGLGDAPISLAQLGAHMIPGASAMAPAVDAFVQDREGKIAAARAKGGETGLDTSRLAGNVVQPLNYLLPELAGAKATTTLGAVGRSALQGAIPAAAQPVTGGDFATEKAKQIGIGAAAGTILHPVVGAISQWGAKVVDPVINFVKGIKGPAAVQQAGTKEILRRIGQDMNGGGPTAQDMLDLLNASPGKPLTLMDVGGENLKALTGRISRAPGDARQIMSKFLNERDLDAGLRLSGDVDKGVGKGSAFSAASALSDARAKAAAPLYDEAFKANQNVASPEIDAILETPAGKKALGQAATKMQNDMTLSGKPDPEIAEQIKESGQYIPFKGGVASGLKLRTLDYVKRSLDDQIGAAQRAGEKDEARILTGLKSKFVSALDKADVTGDAGPNSFKPEGGAYARARGVYSGASQSLDALQAGKDFLKQEPEEIAQEFGALNKGDKEFYKLGAAATLRKAIAKAGPGSDEATKIANSSYTRSQLRPLFDTDESFNNFVNSVKAEGRMFSTRRGILGGSDTARRLAEDGSPESDAFSHAGGAGMHMASGNWLSAGKDMMKAITSLGAITDPAMNAAMARTLTTPLTGSGVKLLRDFANVSPPTAQRLSGGMNPLARAAIIPPLAGAVAGGVQQGNQ